MITNNKLTAFLSHPFTAILFDVLVENWIEGLLP